MNTLLFLAASLMAPSEPSVPVGWSDEMNNPQRWQTLDGDRPVSSSVPKGGSIRLWLEAVPPGWPYEYQWSGITRRAYVNLGKYPVLLARVAEVSGYAHIDVDVIGAKREAVKRLRSSGATEPGVVRLDLSELGRGAFELRLRVILGGPNSGCQATYNWIRFVRKEDEGFFLKNPDFQNISAEWDSDRLW